MTLLKDIFLSIPRHTLEILVKYHILRENVLLWYDLIRFFDSIDLSPEAHRRRISKWQKPISIMEKYVKTSLEFGISDEQCRKVVSKLNTPLQKSEIPQENPDTT